MRPLIGLSTYREQARWGVWDQSADLLPTSYADSVDRAGGVPVLLPPIDPTTAVAAMSRLDGLVVTGGADVDPGRYGAEPHRLTVTWRTDRDAWELALLDAADALGLPVLGICRGMQVMAVRAGGSLEQDLPDVVGHEEHAPGGNSFGWTSIATREGSRVRTFVGDHVQVSCHHHQSVVTHPGFEATARAADGTIEAIEDPERPFWLGVQWHPESGEDHGLFLGLIEAASGVNARA